MYFINHIWFWRFYINFSCCLQGLSKSSSPNFPMSEETLQTHIDFTPCSTYLTVEISLTILSGNEELFLGFCQKWMYRWIFELPALEYDLIFLCLNLDFRYFWFLHCYRTNFVPLGSQMYNKIKIQSHPGINNFIIGCKGLIQTEGLKIAWLGLAICVPQGFHEQQ